MGCNSSAKIQISGLSTPDHSGLVEVREVMIISEVILGCEHNFRVSAGEEQYVRDLAGRVDSLFRQASAASDLVASASKDLNAFGFGELEARAHLLNRAYDAADAELSRYSVDF